MFVYLTILFMVIVKPKDELKTWDVVSVYPDPDSGDKFWLFVVTSKPKGKKIKGRWFDKDKDKDGLSFKLSFSDEIKLNCVVRFGEALDNFYVLPVFNPNEHTYVIKEKGYEKLKAEVDIYFSNRRI